MKIEEFDCKLEKGKAVCFDFDGVIHKYSKGWNDGTIYDTYNKNILDIMLFLTQIGIPVFICSTRKPLQIIEWWNKQGFWADAIKIDEKEKFWNNLNKIGVTNKKLPAQVYIDDRGYKYNNQNLKEFISDFSKSIKVEKGIIINKEK